MEKAFRRDYSSLDQIFGFINEALESENANETVEFALKLATEELFTNMVKWSHQADPGTVPASWDETDPALDAGEKTLSDSPGDNITGMQLGEDFIVYKYETCHVMRYSLRLDGFVSVRAPYKGGELVTKPLVFSGSKLQLNCETGAGGFVQVEIQDQEGKPIEATPIPTAKVQ